MPRWKSMLNSLLDLPQDMVYNLPRLTMVGNRHLVIENYLRILAFDQGGVKLIVNGGSLSIRGDNLVLQSIGREEVVVCGYIKGMFFEEGP